jgi:N-acetylmuramoyl-L-alanine amidase
MSKKVMKKNWVIVLLVLGLTTAVANVSLFQPKKSKKGLRTVVIDAGHGGKDGGAQGNPLDEKHITLAVALKAGKYIEENIPDIKVIYTRTTDKFIPLYERADIANRNKADFFISIHCNSLPSAKEVHGPECYVMGLHTASENLDIAKKVAARENEAILLEKDYKKNYDGYDPNSPTSHILMTLFQNTHIDQSIEFARMMNTQLADRVNRKVRGVHQAGFVVLRAAACPSVLIETGYLTNKEENRFLQSEHGQDLLGSAIYRAVKSYKNELEGGKKNEDEAIYQETSPVPSPPIIREESYEKETDPKSQKTSNENRPTSSKDSLQKERPKASKVITITKKSGL